MPYEPVVPEGEHLGTSHRVDGAVTGHLFEDGTNRLKGHAAWRWVEEDDEFVTVSASSYREESPRELTPEERELAEKLAALIVLGIAVGVKKAAPHVQRWWREAAFPAAKSAWKRISQPRSSRARSGRTRGVYSGRERQTSATFVVHSTGIERAVEAEPITMSRAEWTTRFRSMIAAGAFREEQRHILARARIVEEGEAALERASSPSELTAEEFGNRVRALLAANPSLLEEETAAELIRLFGANGPQPDAPSAQSGPRRRVVRAEPFAGLPDDPAADRDAAPGQHNEDRGKDDGR